MIFPELKGLQAWRVRRRSTCWLRDFRPLRLIKEGSTKPPGWRIEIGATNAITAARGMNHRRFLVLVLGELSTKSDARDR